MSLLHLHFIRLVCQFSSLYFLLIDLDEVMPSLFFPYSKNNMYVSFEIGHILIIVSIIISQGMS